MTEDPANRRPLKSRDTGWARAAASILARAGLSPDAVSAGSMVFAVIGGGLLAASGRLDGGARVGALIVGAACVQLRLLCNLLDGMVAVEHGRGGPTGPIWNELPDRIADALFLVGAGFCQSSHAVLYSFGTLTWRTAGIDDVTISMLWGESVAVEILMMLVSGWLVQRIGVVGLIGVGLTCGLVRWTGMAFTNDLLALVFLQILHGGTFAACHLGAMAFIQRALPSGGVALGQSIYYALGTGATQAVIYQFAGLLYARYGQHAFLGMTVISALGLICIVMLARRWNGGLVVREAA